MLGEMFHIEFVTLDFRKKTKICQLNKDHYVYSYWYSFWRSEDIFIDVSKKQLSIQLYMLCTVHIKWFVLNFWVFIYCLIECGSWLAKKKIIYIFQKININMYTYIQFVIFFVNHHKWDKHYWFVPSINY